MKVAFLTNYYNHHQKFLADEMYKLFGDGNYYFVETIDVPEFRRKMGYGYQEVPSYVLKYNDKTKGRIDGIINEFDVVIYNSSAPLSLVKKRYVDGKLIFCYSERRYKTISRYLKFPIYQYISHYINKGYMLCAGAFVARDYVLSGLHIDKCFKWGYFPEVKHYEDVDSLIASKNDNKDSSSCISILWVGRLIEWKHPETTVYIAKKLKGDGINFNISIIGIGSKEKSLKQAIEKEGLDDCICLLGSLPPVTVRAYMEKADIFLFTSNRQEGWGAVLNESMNSACAVVASDAIGSVPYLIDNGKNGLIYKSGDNDDLYNCIKSLVQDRDRRCMIQKNAYKTMTETWNAKVAASNFLSLVNTIRNGGENMITEGPCSQV